MHIATISTLILTGIIFASDIRIATFNTSMYRSKPGELNVQLSDGTNEQIKAIAAIIQNIQPDIILLNEFDYDPENRNPQLFIKNYLNSDISTGKTIDYEYFFCAPVNTGMPTDFDLNNNGKYHENADCYGFGSFPGQYGMLILSRYQIDKHNIRTFQKFLWKDMPHAMIPENWFTNEELAAFRLSSKSHWDVPVKVNGSTIHILVSHPTPPVFDGPEDLNGRRNHDEIRFWNDYITDGVSGYIYDDNDIKGGIKAAANFVILGDMNNDPFDGDGHHDAILTLLENPAVNTTITPYSKGALESTLSFFAKNAQQHASPVFDTGFFNCEKCPGNLRLDYVILSKGLKIKDAKVFWPASDETGQELRDLVEKASDHRLVYMDIECEPSSHF